MELYNSLSKTKEPLPHAPGQPLRLFVCGPTVYDDAHIGHARTYLFFDSFVRLLRSRTTKITYVQNITDVDDKIIARAKEEGTPALILARAFAARYLADMKALGIESVDAYAPATKFIPNIVSQVAALIEHGAAYRIEGDGYYFDIARFPAYGKLSGRTALQAEDAVSRIDESVGKRNKGDFCLWKFAKEGEPSWNAPFGKGRPGWHIEDTAISEHFFGPQYEIHGGGLDLKFPHHEAEIAEQESVSGKVPFVRLWMHTGMLTVEGRKMSKSLGNFTTIRDFLARHRPAVFRLMVLTHHYRSPMDWSETLIGNHEKMHAALMEFLGKLKARGTQKGTEQNEGAFAARLSSLRAAFNAALDDDMNTPRAIAAVFEFIAFCQPLVWTSLRPKDARAARETLGEFLSSLGIEVIAPAIPRVATALAKKREAYRRNKQFEQSDALRRELDAVGYVVEDTAAGPFLWPKNPT